MNTWSQLRLVKRQQNESKGDEYPPQRRGVFGELSSWFFHRPQCGRVYVGTEIAVPKELSAYA